MTLYVTGKKLPEPPLSGVAMRANGIQTPPTSGTPPATKTLPREARQARFAQAFSHIIAVLMRDANYRNLRLAELEWLVVPPVMAGQWRLAHAKAPSGDKSDQSGIYVPVAVALWARVSPAIDKRLSENLDKQLQLRANEWVSGDNVWLIAAAGNPKTVATFLKQLGETDFKGQLVKMRARGPDGTVVIKTLGDHG